MYPFFNISVVLRIRHFFLNKIFNFLLGFGMREIKCLLDWLIRIFHHFESLSACADANQDSNLFCAFQRWVDGVKSA
ncbi:hypothetical protein ES705_29915 [subsurface metagenome]